MSIKELKELKDLCEQAKEKLKDKVRLSKDIRAQLRKETNDVKELNQEISSLDSHGREGHKSSKERSTFSAKELETLESAFQKIVHLSLFDTFASKDQVLKESKDQVLKESKDQALKESKDQAPKESKDPGVVSVDVEFESVRISFRVNHATRFRDLRVQAASYWSLPVDEIFFSDQDSSNPQCIFLLDNLIIEELYVWKRIKLKDVNFSLYLVLRNYMSLGDRMEQLFPKASSREDNNIDTDDAGQMLVSSKKVRKSKVIDKSAIVKVRRRNYFIQTICQAALFLALFLLWVFLLATEMNVQQATWVNKQLTSVFLWDFSFDDRTVGSLNGTDKVSALMAVTNRDSLWNYIDSVQEKMKIGNTYGVIGDSTYALEFIQLRQHRSSLHICNDTYIGVYNCTGSYYSGFTTEDIGTRDYQKFTHKNSYTFVSGELAVYPLSGYIEEFSVLNVTGWPNIISGLKQDNWIDEGTRAVFVTMNLYNPNSGILTILMPFFEITRSGIFIPNFKVYSVQSSLYSPSRSILHAFIMSITFMLLLLEIRLNIRLVDEINYFKDPSPKIEPHELYDKIVKHHRKNFFKKLRKPSAIQITSFVTLTCVLLVELAGFGWYASKFVERFIGVRGYNNLYGTLQGFGMINDARTVVTLMLGINISKYLITMFTKVSRMFDALMFLVSQYSFYLLFYTTPLLVFAIHFHFFLGPIDNAFKNYSISFVSVIRIFLGQWPSTNYFFTFIDTGYLFILLMTLFIWKMILLNFQIIIFQSKIGRDRIS